MFPICTIISTGMAKKQSAALHETPNILIYFSKLRYLGFRKPCIFSFYPIPCFGRILFLFFLNQRLTCHFRKVEHNRLDFQYSMKTAMIIQIYCYILRNCSSLWLLILMKSLKKNWQNVSVFVSLLTNTRNPRQEIHTLSS